MLNEFEDFLADEHASQFIGTKDIMVDDFEKWLSDLSVDDWILLGKKFKNSILKERVTVLKKVFVEDRIDSKIDAIFGI